MCHCVSTFQGRAVATVGDCPVINWADYAKNREPVDDAHESEGRVFVNLISYASPVLATNSRPPV